MAILVTGGAGYIGSVVVADLSARGEEVIVVDNLVYGHRDALDPSVTFYEGMIGDRELVGNILKRHQITECLHFSAYAYVGESVEDPLKYWENNVGQSISLLNTLVDNGIRKFIFSSTCAIYGEPQYVPIDEEHPQSPTNPYGWSKFTIERVLESCDAAYGMKSVALRYFNAAGATEFAGEDHEPETHLIPIVLKAAQGRLEKVQIFGSDYPTPDGTAIRDYIHISDLSQAHLLALDYLKRQESSEFINLGNGDGYSVKEVIAAAEKITGRAIRSEIAGRREGDPSKLVADARKAKKLLGWEPKFPKLEQIIESAWRWHERNPDGYQR